jgi:diguanylate cyclase (GGDEF)-like protein
MSRVVEHLADLTGYRDRDVLDVSLVGALKDLLRPQAVAIYRAVSDGNNSGGGSHEGQQHWLTRARMAAGDSTATADPLWVEPSTLPTLEAFADRLDCLQRQEAFTVDGQPAMAYFPVGNDLAAVGVLEVQTLAPLSTDDLRLVSSILRIYRNFQGLLEYSERDTLTGLLNRKTFDESFLRVAAQGEYTAGEHQRAGTRRLTPGGLIYLGVLDIDHFKRVNDTHGHLIGDEVLLLLSRLMRSSFRCHDHLYRFGGEEFVVLMRCAQECDAINAFERLRGNVERYAFPQVGRITVSVGVTALRAGDTPQDAFARADKAVYYAKQNGRNQVAHHARLVAEGRLAEEARDNSDAELF